MEKAKALAAYAEKHGEQFGRIQLIVVDSKGGPKRLDVKLPGIRANVKSLESSAQLRTLFGV
ncbi:MAG: hypothetical protein FJ290_21390 [Planctomycetes bacterium]|nr:hypothetical protein [Planctomycetota bacterium]